MRLPTQNQLDSVQTSVRVADLRNRFSFREVAIPGCPEKLTESGFVTVMSDLPATEALPGGPVDPNTGIVPHWPGDLTVPRYRTMSTGWLRRVIPE